jgi:uncharacterized oligopeptide transporter (OPT) family protein
MIFAGGLVAVAIILLDKVLEARGSTFRTPVLAVAVGIYLPIELSVPIFIGGVVAYAGGRALSARRAELGAAYDEVESRSGRNGLLFASGLITGEALVGILLAIPFALAESTTVLALPLEGLGLSEGGIEVLTHVLGVGAFACFVLWLYRVVARTR